MPATKVVIDNITFDSKFEAAVYITLKKIDDVKIIDTHRTLLLQDSFKVYDTLKGKLTTIRKMVYTPDFIIEYKGITIAVEAKGWARPEYKMRKKLFLNKYVLTGEYQFLEVFTLKDIKKGLKHIYDLIEDGLE